MRLASVKGLAGLRPSHCITSTTRSPRESVLAGSSAMPSPCAVSTKTERVIDSAEPVAVAAVLVWRAGPGRLGNGLWLGLVLGFGLTFVLGIVTGFAIGGNGGHFVAAAGAMPGNDLGGIPVFGWSREVGDLRAAHFVGLHVMQILPLVGWAADRLAPRASPWAVLVMALALTGLTVWALVVALSGQSVVPAGW